MRDKRTKTWLSILAAVLIVIVMLGAAAVGGSIYFFYSHIRQTPTEDTEADDRFARERQRLSNRRPLIEIDDRDEPVILRPDPTTQAARDARLRTLRVLVYEPREQRMVDVDIPFWLLRVMPSGGRFSFLNDHGIDFDSERTRLTVEDLERHGAGLVLDHRDRRGAQVLVWTE
jgi:hypothetical protein